MSRDIERVLQAVPIETYIAKYVSLKRKGNNFWGLCPFHHEKTPSFAVSPEKGIFKCFGCGKGGNVISFVMEYDHLSFAEALRLLAEYAGITLEGKNQTEKEKKEKDKKQALLALQNWVVKLYQQQLAHSKAARYLEARGVSAAAIEHFKIGYAPNEPQFLEKNLQKLLAGNHEKQKIALENLHLLGLVGTNSQTNETYNRFRDRLIFPIQDLQGNTIAFGGRILEERDNTGKYVNSPDSSLFHKKHTLFHLFEAKEEIRRCGTAIVVEGYFDVLGLWEKNIRNVVAPLGTAFTLEQAKLLKRYTNRAILFFDNDPAGIEAVFKAMNTGRLSSLEMRIVSRPVGQKSDPFDLSRQKTTEELLLLLDEAQDELSYTLWYFFQYKYNIAQLTAKKQAVADFFAHLETLTSELERQEYLKAAAALLQIDLSLLQQDFKKKQPLTLPSQLKNPVPVVTSKLTRSEKDILALLLKYPTLWSEAQSLLEKHQWETDSGYLLYSFFHDRFLSGELWTWEKLSPVLNLLVDKPSLRDELSGLVLEYENHFATQVKLSPEQVGRYLQEILLRARLSVLEKKRETLLKELAREEKLNPPLAEKLTLEVVTVGEEITKLNDFLSLKH